MTTKKIFIHSIPRPHVLGIDKWANDTSNKSLNKTKILDRCTDRIPALYSPKIGGLLNGLSYHPWIENGEQKLDDSGNALTLQDKKEKQWNLHKGFLTNKPYRRGDSMKEEDLTYYQKQTWALKDGTTVLDLANMDHDLGYHVMLDSKFIANSEKEWRANKWPQATHYIAHENEGEEIKFKKTQRKSKAFAKLESEDLTPTYKEKFSVILDLSSPRSMLTDEQRYNLLYDFVESTSYTPGSNIDKFEELVKLLSTADGRSEIEARYLIKRALDARIIYEKQGSYNWPRPKGLIVIGETYGDAIAFFLNPKKQVLIEELEEELKVKNA